ncbi:MmgE/PrpD family protein [Variovorax sp. J22P240]|uniref:MmgE/PrpD family protein n=1 Tax=Variovorax sp. J22P240 TaxID=3053514 RepID=UPI0025770B44|nr:MmgE/PrpD family protein [Variovorax sp. J22P240]MDL9998553.1 MmgE/PrpD family protein [Variovorax sp. J22P240]
MNKHPSQALATFAAELSFEQVPDAVIRRTEDLMLDWLGSVLAARSARPVRSIQRFAEMMGPADGPSEVLISRRTTSPVFAALVNAAASHYVEQDDVHNGSVFHPAAVVFAPALATAQAVGASGAQLLTAVVAGYEVGIRVGEFLGRSHYRTFHTTATAGTLAAAAAVGRLLDLSPAQMLHAFGSAGTQSAGVWEFLRDAADSKQLHCAHAAASGLMSAYLAQDGFTGAARVLEGAQGLGVGMSTDADPARLTDGLGTRWALAETSFKYHASCRHTHPAADALLEVMTQNGLKAGDIERVVTHVHQGAIDVLGRVVVPATVHQGKFSMGTVLGLIAVHGRAGLTEFDRDFVAPEVAAFRDKVMMELDREVDTAYPARWIGKVSVTTSDGRTLSGRVDEPKGDPGNTLSRAEIEDKMKRLTQYGEAATPQEAQALCERVWALAGEARVGRLLG